jgi:catalase
MPGDIVTVLYGTAVTFYPFRGYFDDAFHPFPVFFFVNPVEFSDNFTASDLSPPVAFIQMLAITVFFEIELVDYLLIKGS